MIRFFVIVFLSVFTLAGCAPPPLPPALGSDGKPLPQVYRISQNGVVPEKELAKIQFRVLDSVNVLRAAAITALQTLRTIPLFGPKIPKLHCSNNSDPKFPPGITGNVRTSIDI